MIITRPLTTAPTGTAICGISDAVGDLVYISGNKVGSDYSVSKVDPGDYNKFPAVAVVIYKITSTKAVIQFSGEIKGIYTGLTAGKTYWAGSSGTPVVVPPTPTAGNKMRVQSIGIAVDSDILRFEPLKDATTRIG
jgi:hypothetical protein